MKSPEITELYNQIGGQGVLMKLKGNTVEEMRIKDVLTSLKMACGENPKRNYGSRLVTPMSRMGKYGKQIIYFIIALYFISLLFLYLFIYLFTCCHVFCFMDFISLLFIYLFYCGCFTYLFASLSFMFHCMLSLFVITCQILKNVFSAWIMRSKLNEAKTLMTQQDKYCQESEMWTTTFPEDISLNPLVSLLRGQALLNIHCYRVHDIGKNKSGGWFFSCFPY
jgi:hypothetical protein